MGTKELTSTEIAACVCPYVAAKTTGDIALSVEADHIQLRNGYWRIPIRPSREPEPLFPNY